MAIYDLHSEPSLRFSSNLHLMWAGILQNPLFRNYVNL